MPGGVRELYWDYIKFSKESFTRVLVWISRKTTLIVTVDESIDLATLVEREQDGAFKGFKFPARTVWLSNHQMYADWIYTWCLFSYANLHGGTSTVLSCGPGGWKMSWRMHALTPHLSLAMVIVLKASLRNVPIGGER